MFVWVPFDWSEVIFNSIHCFDADVCKMVIILCNIADFSRTSRTYYIIIASVTAHLRKQVLAISDFITSIQTSHKIETIGFSVSSNPLLYYFRRIYWCISTLIVNGIIWLHMLTSSLSNLAVLTLSCTVAHTLTSLYFWFQTQNKLLTPEKMNYLLKWQEPPRNQMLITLYI